MKDVESKNGAGSEMLSSKISSMLSPCSLGLLKVIGSQNRRSYLEIRMAWPEKMKDRKDHEIDPYLIEGVTGEEESVAPSGGLCDLFIFFM